MSNDVLKKVREIFERAFGIDPHSVSLETNPDGIPAWDSVGHLSLVALLEEGFEIRFDVDDLSGMDSVRAIVRIIEAKKKPAAEMRSDEQSGVFQRM